MQHCCAETEDFEVGLQGFGWRNERGSLTFWLGVKDTPHRDLQHLALKIQAASGAFVDGAVPPFVEIGYCERWFGRSYARKMAARFSGVEEYGVLPVKELVLLETSAAFDSSGHVTVTRRFPLKSE